MDGEHATRLEFELPEFVRFAWTGEQARSVWEPRFQRMRLSWSRVERASVARGLRSCHLVSLGPEVLCDFSQVALKEGLHVVPLRLLGAGVASYSSRSQDYAAGQPFEIRVVVGEAEAASEFVAAWSRQDDDAIGELLGYPECCREFFRKEWLGNHLIDTTWQMAVNGRRPRGRVVVHDSWLRYANILWRWLGIRAVSHLPCSFVCEATQEIGLQLNELEAELGCSEEAEWRNDVLSWPVEWSALHGIGELKTPVMKACFCTDATSGVRRVQLRGNAYPEAGAVGAAFPYRQSMRGRVTELDGGNCQAAPSTEAGVAPLNDDGAWRWTDNGFSSLVAMDQAHKVVIAATVAALEECTASPGKPRLLDLGCGNGMLLARISSECEFGIECFGCDTNGERIQHSSLVGLPKGSTVGVGNIFDPDSFVWKGTEKYDVVLLMPGRLLEVDGTRASAVRQRLCDRARIVLAYTYADGQSADADVVRLGARAGLRVIPLLGGNRIGRVAWCDSPAEVES